MATLATPTLMLVMAITTARGLLRPLPLPSPSPTMATTAFATTVMLASLTLMVVTTMESKKESKCQQTKATTCWIVLFKENIQHLKHEDLAFFLSSEIKP